MSSVGQGVPTGGRGGSWGAGWEFLGAVVFSSSLSQDDRGEGLRLLPRRWTLESGCRRGAVQAAFSFSTRRSRYCAHAFAPGTACSEMCQPPYQYWGRGRFLMKCSCLCGGLVDVGGKGGRFAGGREGVLGVVSFCPQLAWGERVDDHARNSNAEGGDNLSFKGSVEKTHTHFSHQYHRVPEGQNHWVPGGLRAPRCSPCCPRALGSTVRIRVPDLTFSMPARLCSRCTVRVRVVRDVKRSL